MAVRRRVTSRERDLQAAGAFLISIILLTAAFIPSTAQAGVIADLISKLRGTATESAAPTPENVQTMELPKAAVNLNPSVARGGGEVLIVDESALVPAEGPSGTLADIEKPKNGTISRYVVRPGDTLSGIGKLFGVSVNTIRWANDMAPGSTLRIGQELVILPVTGMRYAVKPGDTIASIAKKYGADAGEIASYNDISGSLAVGSEIIIPDGEIAAPAPKAVAKATKPRSSSAIGAEPAHDVGPVGSAAQDAYYIAPLNHYIKTQGVHGYNAVDLAAPVGTPILASAAGEVIVAREGGWNGGYGSYVVIQHDNGSQTLYAHMSSVDVYDGQSIVQGQVIGRVGSTGKSTGAHVHFEIRNGIRNPF